MSTIASVETLNQFFASKYPSLLLVVAFVMLTGFSAYKFDNLGTRVENIEKNELPAIRQDIKQIENRVYKLEVKVDVLVEDVRELKQDMKEAKKDISDMKTDIAIIKNILLKKAP